MPSISYNGQSFAIDGRRFWVLGASIQYARVPAELWDARIAAARQAGFNTIETACPWTVHEPRNGRFNFEGEANVRKFIQTCAAHGCRVILRVGPYVNDQFDGGGLPGWLIETPDVRLRQSNPIFLEHVSRYFRRLLSEVVDLQVTTGGPILLVQSEHGWTCTNDAQARTYLHEVTRFIRESGITVPIINTNDLWQDVPGTIDTWRGYEHLLAHLRQLRSVQPDAPRLVTFEAADVQTWGGETGRSSRRGKTSNAHAKPEKNAGEVLRHLAEVLAAGAQPIVSPFHAGTNFDFLAGRVAGQTDGFVTTAGAQDPPLGQAGTRGEKYHMIRRLITFANHFSHIFAELDQEYQPIVIDPVQSETGDGRPRQSVVPLRSPQGRIVFVFAGDHEHRSKHNPRTPTATIVLDDGIRLPVHLGDQTAGWFALDVDLQGLGTLDFSNICPWGMVDRSIIVFHGPAGAPAYISISSTPLEVTVPTNQTPVVVEHKGLTIVVCNHAQIDATYHDESAVYVGIDGFDANGLPLRDPRFSKSYVIRKGANITELKAATPETNESEKTKGGKESKSSRKRNVEAAPKSFSPIHNLGGAAPALGTWQLSPATAYVTGESPRFASLDGPETLSHCGAPSGYGWYRVKLNATARTLCHAPRANDRLHMFIDGQRQALFGAGPGAHSGVFELRPSKTSQTLVVLADNFGRFADGNDLGQCKGLWGHVYRVKPLRSVKPKKQDAKPVDPFVLRGFIAGRAAGMLSDSTQAVWTFNHTRKTSIIIDVAGAVASGTFVLNDKPIAYYAGATGACGDRIVLDPADHLKRGKNVLRFAPDLRQENPVDDISRHTELFECVDVLTDGSNAWAFAKWEPPHTSTFDEYDSAALRSVKGLPCWWRTSFDVEESNSQVRRLPLWLEMNGMSKGQVFINGRNIGRYFTATGTGKAVGPQTRLYVPDPWLKPGHPNEVVIFDEHGCEPSRVKLVRAAEA